MRLKNKDIAERLGISPTAVSLALNGKPGVSDETRRRVFEIVSEDATHAYRDLGEPPAKAGTIILSVHKSTGKIINDLPFFSNLIESVQQAAMYEGYQVILAHYVPGQDLDAYISYLSGLEACALLLEATELTHEELEAYKALDLPMVLMDGFFDLEDIDAVTLDDMTAVYRAFDYAWSMGHRRIGFLAGDAQIQNFAHHRDGFAKGVREHGADPASCPIVTVGCSAEESYRDVSAMLADKHKPPEGPTCWIAQLDYIAVGALRALSEAKIRVPDDVSLIGYGDIEVVEMTNPPLTTTRINRADCGRLAMRALAFRIAHPEAPHTITTVGSQLVERQSVKRLKPQD